MPSLEEDVRLRRMETMLRWLSNSLNPQISMGEIQHLLGLKDRAAAQQWLDEHKLKPVTKWRYRRLEVIEAREQDATTSRETAGHTIKVELSLTQLETICRLLADELNSATLAPSHSDDYLEIVRAWRTDRDSWLDRYLERFIDNRENAEQLWRTLDANADLLEQLAVKLPG